MSTWQGTLLLRSVVPAVADRMPRLRRETITAPPEHRVILSYALTMVSLCLVVLILNITVVSHLQHFTAQSRLYDEFRQSLAEGSIPIGQTDVLGNLVQPGTPVALLTVPALDIEEVVVEGTSSAETMKGVGHRRDTPLPGQPGVAVLMGRASAYGGVFGDLEDLDPGDEFSITTGQGEARYRVLGARQPDTVLPVLGPDDGRLTLVTATGPSFRPTGVLRVDAELVTTAFARPTPVIGSGGLSPADDVLSGDNSNAFALSWLLELLALLVVAAIWSWKRWQRAATWLVFVPVLGAVGLAVAANVSLLMPNLM